MSAGDAMIEAIAEAVARKLMERGFGVKPSVQKRLLTLKEAGEMIGRSSGAVNQLIKRKELRAVSCGRRIHIEISEIEGWIKRCAL